MRGFSTTPKLVVVPLILFAVCFFVFTYTMLPVGEHNTFLIGDTLSNSHFVVLQSPDMTQLSS